ncbi:MAG: NADH-quinone oxidoreductase subunit K [Thiobacillaceae bacterium]
MSTGLLYALAGVLLFVLGAAGVVLLAHLLRRILAFNVMGSGAFLVLVGLAQRDGVIDPVPQAMVLTGIVVAVAATALALGLARALHARAGHAGSGQEARRD